jgi:hypothetical protein
MISTEEQQRNSRETAEKQQRNSRETAEKQQRSLFFLSFFLYE